MLLERSKKIQGIFWAREAGHPEKALKAVQYFKSNNHCNSHFSFVIDLLNNILDKASFKGVVDFQISLCVQRFGMSLEHHWTRVKITYAVESHQDAGRTKVDKI